MANSRVVVALLLPQPCQLDFVSAACTLFFNTKTPLWPSHVNFYDVLEVSHKMRGAAAPGEFGGRANMGMNS